MGEYQRERDEHVLPMYEFTCQLATMEPPPPEVQQVLAALPGNQDAMDGFVQKSEILRPVTIVSWTTMLYFQPPSRQRLAEAWTL